MSANSRACAVCGGTETKLLFHPRKSPGPVSQCLHCGMVYISSIEDQHALIFNGPAPRAQMDPKILTSTNLKDIMDSKRFRRVLKDKELEFPAVRCNAIEALTHLEAHLKTPAENRKMLDFGSGWGFFLAVAKERGWIPYGLEPLPVPSVYARSKFGAHITTDTLRRETFPSDYFDAITSIQVFEHLPYPEKDLGNLNAILRKEGVLLIEVPNFDTWSMRLMRSRHRHFVQDHLNFFSINTLSRLLEKTGFQVIDHFYPKRCMTINHLFKHWLSNYLPESVTNSCQRFFQRTGLWKWTIRLGVGDIVTVIARKPA